MQSCRWSTITSPACPHRKYLVDFLCTVSLLECHSSRAVFLSIPSSCREFIRQFDGTEAVASSRLLHIPSFSLLSLPSPLSFSLEWLYNGVRRRRNHQRHRRRRRRRGRATAKPGAASERASAQRRGKDWLHSSADEAKGVPLPRASLGPAPPGRQSPRGSD